MSIKAGTIIECDSMHSQALRWYEREEAIVERFQKYSSKLSECSFLQQIKMNNEWVKENVLGWMTWDVLFKRNQMKAAFQERKMLVLMEGNCEEKDE